MVAIVVVCGCSEKQNDPDPHVSGEEPGFGGSLEDPVGQQFTFPSQISLDGGHVYTPDYCLTPDSLIGLLATVTREKIHGTPGYFVVCMTLTNSSSQPVTIRCPAGLTFVCERDETGRPRAQNGIIVYDVTITVSPKATESFLLDLYCLNASRTRPAMETRFTPGPVTENQGMRKLIQILADKKIRNDELGEDWIPVLTAIQGAVWDVADKGAVSERSLVELNKLK
jgi:hypothetical protein